MKNEIVGLVVAFVITLFMMFITKTSAYVEVADNILVAILLLFTMVVIGYLVAKGLVMLFDKDKDKKSLESEFL